ncbi:MAG: POTRA domain-containing protein, partial [Woeseiaceae bacterium]
MLLLASLARGELRVEGVSDEIAHNVRSYVALAGEPCDADTWLVRRRFRALETEARSALEPFGYYDPTIEKTLELDEECWRATLRIDAGNPVVLRNVDVSIATPPEGTTDFYDIESSSPLVAGTPLRHADYETLKESLQVRAAERGYADASFTRNIIDVWPDERAADISLEYESGPRYDFGEIRIEDNFLEDSLVRAFLEFDTGMPFDSRLLNQAYSDLSLSGYFSRIELLPVYEEASNQKIPIRVLLEPADRIEYTIGAGFSTDTGPRFRAGFENRRLNSKGHRFKSNIGISPIIQGITAEHRRPMADPRSEWLSYTAALTREDGNTFKSDTARVGFRRSKRISRNWLRTLSTDFSYERFDVGAESRRTRLTLPGVSFDHKRADRDIFPTRGRRLTVDFRGTGEFLGSDTS